MFPPFILLTPLLTLHSLSPQRFTHSLHSFIHSVSQSSPSPLTLHSFIQRLLLSMGNIKLDCLAVNPNNTIVYGIGNAYIDGTYTATHETGSLLLVRSEPNPTSFKSIKWTIVSIIQAKNFPYYWAQTFDSVDCAVSRTGIFTALAVLQQTYQSQGSIEWTGIKYDPALGVKGADGQVGGLAGWERFGTGNEYRWSNALSLMSHAAIYYDQRVKVQGGPAEGVVKERFIHAAENRDGQLRFGSFGPQDSLSNDTIATWNLNNSLPSVSLFLFVLGATYRRLPYLCENTNILTPPISFPSLGTNMHVCSLFSLFHTLEKSTAPGAKAYESPARPRPRLS